jgi:signal transduction histidine kinase
MGPPFDDNFHNFQDAVGTRRGGMSNSQDHSRHLSIAFNKSTIPFAIIAISAAIPLILLGIISGYRSSTQERQTVALQVALRAERLAHQIDAQLESEIEAAQPLVNLRRLTHDDTSSFLEHARRLEGLHREWVAVSLAAATGSQILNADSPDGSPAGSNAGLDGFQQAVGSGHAVVGGLLDPGVLGGAAAIPLHLPVSQHGVARFLVTVGIAQASFQAILSSANLPSGWDGALIDAGGRVIAGTGTDGRRQGAATTGQRLDLSVCCNGVEGIHEETGSGDRAVYAVSERIGLAGWTVHLRMPRQVLDRPVNRAWKMISLAGVGMLILTGLLASLVAHVIAERRRAEMEDAGQVLLRSEAWRLMAVEVADIGTWHWPFGADTIEWCDRCLRLVGLPAASGPYDSFLSAVHPEDRPVIDRAMQRCRTEHAAWETSLRILLPGGGQRWIHMSGRVPTDEPGQPAGIYGVIVSIDKQKRAEADHRELLSRLHSAQEEERRRIARDLHDRVGQTVAGLSLRLKRLEVEVDSPATRDACRDLKRMISDISQDIHRAAVELRPTALDDIGLKDALQTVMDGWHQQTGLEVDVFINGLDAGRLPAFIETTVYRILIELLTNIVKHAGADAVCVTLDRRPGQVMLIVEDDGRGFKPPAAAGSAPRHLGLLGIRERLELVGGQLQIESAPGRGTVAIVRIPLSPELREGNAA